VSLFGLILSVLFAVSPQVSQESFVWRKPLVGSAFAAVCILGILAVLFPKTCSKPFAAGTKRKRLGPQVSHATSSDLRGHHPQCVHFSGHVFAVGERVFCATCSGLFLGALLALVGDGAYFFGDWRFGQNAVLVVAVGAVGVAVGLLQSSLPIIQKGVMRLFTGAFFVAGAFLILLGIEESTRSVSLDLFVVALSILCLATKISLSQWDHERICSRCTSGSFDCKVGLLRKEV
jgi:hypothetical protein